MENEAISVVNSPAKSKQTSSFLLSIVRTLSSSADFEQREQEKKRIEKAFKESDKKLGDLVKESREKIKHIKEDLSSCKTLLHCKRDELRKLWIDGVEQKTIAALLDQIEQVKNVPEKLDNHLAKKEYLQATNCIVGAGDSSLAEGASVDPEEDPQRFISVLLESLFILRKVPEAAEAIKMRMHPELIAIVARASHQVVDSTGGQGENLMTQFLPRQLGDLLELIFRQFRAVAEIHKNSGVYIRPEHMYTMKDVWSKIQAVVSLFRFDASIHALSTNSYVEDTRQFDVALIHADTIDVTPITTVKPIKRMTSSLHEFLTEFVEKIYLGHVHYVVSNNIDIATKGIVQYDADEKRVISATWAKDEDISRFLRSLPSWRSLQPSDGHELNRTVCSEEEMRALNSKEAVILITNLSFEEAFIPQHEIITDVTQMRTVANVHESLSAPTVSHKTLESLNGLVKDFQDLAEICLLLLHLESNYAGPIDDLDPDSNVLKLNKDLSSMEEKILTGIGEKGAQFVLAEYTQLLQLYHRSHYTTEQAVIEGHMARLRDVLKKGQNE
ncbi:EXOC4-like protein [Mya arenaria]|uniref:Exocyst complex component Sec8 n=1 Tax=Mya arenaria TaxID=6604 RepID=A0ABY7FID4_MYAAR|nr:EXOC4-like protein [Mya arenaria]